MHWMVSGAVFTLVSCAGAARTPSPPTPVDRSCHLVPNPQAYMTTLHGTVMDRSGRLLPGATVKLVHWSNPEGGAGVWHRDEALAQTTSDQHGMYALMTAYGSYQIEAQANGGKAIGVGYRADGPSRQLDITIDPGVETVFDAAILDLALCDERCPRDHAPREEWWLDPHPCPANTQLKFDFDGERGTITIACRGAREGHGALTTWRQTHDGWIRTSGWLSHGEACGEWTDPQPAPAPPAP